LSSPLPYLSTFFDVMLFFLLSARPPMVVCTRLLLKSLSRTCLT
jgi:hypothetical protein